MWDVDRMLENISSTMLQEWMIFYSIDPFGEKRGDLRAAMLAAVTAKSMGAKRVDPRKFVLDFETKRIRQAGQWQRDLQALKAFSMVHNAKLALKERDAGGN